MEKENKIQHRQTQSRQKAFTVIFILVICLLLYHFTTIESNSQQNDLQESHKELNAYVNAVRNPVLAEEIVKIQQQALADPAIPIENMQGHIMSKAVEILPNLERNYQRLDEMVRKIKATGVIMEKDEESLKATSQLQDAARKLLVAKYGHHSHYRVKVDLEFPPTTPNYSDDTKYDSLIIEMAPIELIPVSVYTFLEVARTFQNGAFHRNAGHVLQVRVRSSVISKTLAFQEYSPDFPHEKGTTGYCGRPSGPCWYVSIQDNTRNHGPGSQQKQNPYEADANFGTIVEGGMDTVVPRIHSIPQNGWLSPKNQIQQLKYTILVPSDDTNNNDESHWVPWMDSTTFE